MKQLLFILIIAAIASCSKDNKKAYCYHCTFGFNAGGIQHPPKDTCSDDPASTYWFRDANGNDLNFFCEPK